MRAPPMRLAFFLPLLALTVPRAALAQTFDGDFSLSSGAVYQTAFVDEAKAVAVDTITAGGPFIYVTGDSNDAGATVKLSSAGVALASAAFIGGGMGVGHGVAVDPSGNPWVVGHSVTGGPLTNWVVKKYNPNLVVVASTLIAGVSLGDAVAASIAFDASGNAFVAGYSSNTGTGTDYRIVKYSPSLAVLASASYGGAGVDHANALTIDASGNVIVTGYFTPYDYATVKFSSALVVLSTAAYDASGATDRAYGVTTDPSGNVYVTGESDGGGANYGFTTVKYDASLVQQAVASYNTPAYDAGFGAVFVGTATLVVVGNSFAGATEDMVILEYGPGLVLSSSRTFDSGTSDRAYGVAKGTGTYVYATGYSFTSPSGAFRTIRLNDSATPNPAYPGCAATNNVGAGQAYLTIQSAVDGLPASLTGPACVVIRDGAAYPEQVTVRGIANNGWPVRIFGDPAAPAPSVVPPAASTAAFMIANASVTVSGLDIAPGSAIPYGVFISSPYVALSSVNVQDAGGKIATAAIAASSWTTVSRSSVTVGGAGATGIWLPGSVGTAVSYSSVAANGSSAYAMRLSGAASNTIADSLFVNLPGSGIHLSGSDRNTISRSSIACDNGTGSNAALYLTNSSSNTVTETFLRNWYADAVSLNSNSNYNAITQSTAVLRGAGGQAAIDFNGSSYNSVSGCLLTASGGLGINFGTSHFNTVSQTTMSTTNGMGRQALLFNVSSSNTVTQCYIANPDETGISYFNGSSYNAVSQSTIIGGPSSNLYPSGVYITNGSYNTITQSRISNAGAFGATFGSWAMHNTISLSTITSGAAGYPGVYFMSGSGTNTVSGSYVQGSTAAYVVNVQGAVIDSSVLAGGPAGPGIFLDYGSSGTIVLSGNSITGARHGVRISTQSASLSISSLAFAGLAPGATAVHFLGGTFVATITAASFDASAAANVDASLLDPSSRVTMSAASGARAGAAYEADPGSLVDWPGTIAFTPTGLTASGVGLAAATLSWGANGNLAGTLYELERSSGTGYGLQSSSTALSYVDATLTAASTYSYRVRAISTDQGYSAYGSTVALVTYPVTARPEISSFAPSSAAAGTSVAASVAGTGFLPSASLWLERTPPDQGVWTATGSFTQVRLQGAMAKLRDGRVLLAGGLVDGVPSGRAETDLFDPATGAWTATAPLRQGRYEAASALLADGRVLVAGGVGAGVRLNSAEVYDPSISTWTTVAPMSTVRQGHQMVLLSDGRVLVAGGIDDSGKLSSAEIYDPAANAWSAAASMASPRSFPVMILLGNGKALISGDTGASAASMTAELYDPAGNAWTAAGAMAAPRYYHQAVLLPDGRVLVSGGGGTAATNTADVYDPAANAWSPTGLMGAARYAHAMVTVNGAPLILGGENTATLSSTEIYDLVLNAWRPGPPLALGARSYPRAVVLEDGNVLAAGGLQALGGGPTLNTSELLVLPLAQIAATGVAVTSASALSGTLGLTGAATGYWDAVVRGPDGRAGRLSGGFLAVSTPAAPSGFAGAVLSPSSILWSWTDASSDEAGFLVMSGTAAVSGILAARTTVWLQTGLGGNVASGPLSVRAYNLAGAADSSTATRTTFAAVPAGLAASGVHLTSGTVTWSTGVNSAGTVYQLERSTGAGYGLRLSGASTSYFDADLTPGGTHFYRVLAINADSIATAYTATLTVVASPLPSAPGAAGTPAGTPLGVSSVAWTWTLASGASSYNLFRSSDGGYHASTATGALTLAGLAPNTAYGLRAAGVNIGGMGPLSAAATAYTLAADPAGTGTAVTSTTVVASWTLNGNPAATVAELLRSTDSVVYSTLTVGAVTSFAETGLLGCTTYYYRVRNLNGDGLATAYASFSAVTANTIPSPPSGLTAAANAGGTVGLTWGLSPTEGVTGYRLYWDAGTGTVSYGAPIAALGAAATGYTTGVLTSSASYTFALRAAHRCGTVETTGAIAMSGAAAATPAVRAAVKEPDSGRRISGDRVTMLGELVYGTPSDVQQVLFQYKLATSSAWLNVPAANVNHSNPDLDFPYFAHWDVTVLPAGSYDLRAVAYARSGVPDPAPPAVRIAVDPVAPDIREALTGDGKIKKDQTISNAVSSVVETAGAGASDPAVRVTLPPGVVNTATATVSVIANPSITTAPPSGQTMVGSAVKIDLSNGQTALAGTAAITLTYPESIKFPSLLQIYYLDEATGRWSRDFATTVDTASRTVTGNTPHFSTFVLMLGTAFSSSLDSVWVYPVPYKPNGANPDEGRAFTHGDANSGIIFANLASASEIKIYTLTGRLVSSLDTPTIAGTVRWDARNQDGREVASGAYFAVISAPGHKSVVKKLVIIR